MAKVLDYGDGRVDGKHLVAIRCPACEASGRDPFHGLDVANVHKWNGDFEKPTFTPSLGWMPPYANNSDGFVCHSFITDGRITYCGDSHHAMAGQTVELLDFDPEVIERYRRT